MLGDAKTVGEWGDWAAASDVQQRFMRRAAAPLDTLDYSARCRQMHEVGGDCYDFFPFADEGLAITVADASGKGLAAALMISNVQSSLRTAALLAGGDLATMIGAVNRQVYESSLSDRYATVFYGLFDARSRTLRYVNAGHNPPMVIRRDGSIAWLETGGAPVGMFAHWQYQEGTVRLEKGDVVVLYTDGLPEAVNASGEQWGVEGLQRSASASRQLCAEGAVDDIFRSFDEFCEGRQVDDATVAVLRVR
jgi:sigma-B regulation protein RsbU (phosphoserine phosphatase)